MNYSGPAAVGYELQWACGSGVVNYSGPVAVGLRVTVGLYCGSGVRNHTSPIQGSCGLLVN